MVSIARTRSREINKLHISGTKTTTSTFFWNGNPFGTPSSYVNQSSAWNPGTEDCRDRLTLAAPREPNELEITRREGRPGRISGTYAIPKEPPNSGFQYVYDYDGFVPSRLGSQFSTGVKVYAPQDLDYWLTVFLSRNAGSDPILNIPLFLWELRELPSLIKFYGDILRRKGRGGVNPSDHWLAYSFGWRPFLSDLHSLLTFGKEVNERAKKLMAARGGGHVRKTLMRFSDEVTIQEVYDAETVSIRIYDKRDIHVWGTGHYAIYDNGEEITRLLDKLVNGTPYLDSTLNLFALQPRAKDLWDGIPWSWLVDYFVNIGDILDYTGNRIPYKLKDVCIMCQESAIETSEVRSNPNNLDFSPHEYHRYSKRRAVYRDPTPRLRLRPFIRGKSLLNLGALLTSSRMRGISKTS